MQRCHGAPSTCASAAFRPGCASLMASCTPTRPRATRLRRNSVQNASVSASPTSRPMISRRPVSWTACATTTHLRCDAAAVADLLDLRVDEQIGVAALQRPLAKRLHLLVEQPGDPADLGLADPQPEALDELIDPPGRDAADIGLLDHRRPAPARSACAAAGTTGSSCPDGSWGSATRSPQPWCPTAWADSRCDASRGPRLRSPCSAPISSLTSASISSCATARTDSRITSPCSSRSTCLTTSSIVILSRPAIAGLLSSKP